MSYQKREYDNSKEFQLFEEGKNELSKIASSGKVWAIYKGGEAAGKGRSDLIKVEARIKEIEVEKEWDGFDFDKRWANKNSNPQSSKGEEYTLSEAESSVDDNEFKEFKQFIDKALALKKLGVIYIEEKDPTLKGNPAGSGQVINMAFYMQIFKRLSSG